MTKSDDPKTRTPSEAITANFEPGPPPVSAAPGPDGMPAPVQSIAPAPPPPEMSVDNCMCLRGPCRHYWRLVSHFDAGNASGLEGLIDPETGEEFTFEGRQINHTCLANPGHETDLSGDIAYECNLWDPLLPKDMAALEHRREQYYQIRPQHRPKDKSNG